MITHEDLKELTEEQIKKVESMLPHDDEYLTTFHKEWNEARVRENIRVIKKEVYTIDEISLMANKGMKSKDIKLAESIIEENKEVIITEWIKIYGK